MRIAQFQFKCRRCGEIDSSLETGEAMAKQRLIECLINGKSCHNDIPLMMKSVHTCKDGSCGVTDLIGYEIIKEDT